MEFTPINLLYFAIVIPVMILYSLLSRKFRLPEKSGRNIVALTVALFFVRIMLVVFADSIGTMPYVKDEVVFYGILTVFGVGFALLYTRKIEGLSFAEIGWTRENLGRNIAWGFLSLLPLLAMLPLLQLLTGLEIAEQVTWEKIYLAVGFGLLLGGIYEETMFRGIMQNHLIVVTGENERKTILYTALLFTATHIFYLPFWGYGIFYLFLFVMAAILSILRTRCSQVACFICHGGIVFLLVILV